MENYQYPYQQPKTLPASKGYFSWCRCNGVIYVMVAIVSLLLVSGTVIITVMAFKHHEERPWPTPRSVLTYPMQPSTLTTRLSCVGDFRLYAHERLDEDALNFFEDGAMTEETLRDNMAAFRRYRLRPKLLRDVSAFTPTVTVLGRTYATPIGLSPVALLSWVHEDGDVAAARAAEAKNTIFIQSVHSSTTMEDVAKAAGDVTKWIQIYPFQRRSDTAAVVRQAEAAGYKAVVVTIDSPVAGIMYNEERGVAMVPDGISPALNISGSWYNPAQDWDDIFFITKLTRLPVVLKGPLAADDIVTAAGLGVKAVLLSNHGGRSVDGLPGSLDLLPEAVKAAAETQLEVYLDGGIRTGTDVFKALALGARMVFVGRPLVYGLSYKGQIGVERVLEILTTEFTNTAQQCGAPSTSTISSDMISGVH